MSVKTLLGRLNWSLNRDSEGYRTYKLTLLLLTDDASDGPESMTLTSGLPQVGDYWAFGNDVDSWCWCRFDADFKPVVDKEANFHWTADYTFSNKPYKPRCATEAINDPLLEPMKVSGGFVKKSEEAVFDRNGQPIVNSSFEIIRGPQIEFDVAHYKVKVEQNVANLDLALMESLRDHVNDGPMWGFQRRQVRLMSFDWDKSYYGTCFFYYKRTFEFELDVLTFDKKLLDEGSKCLRGHWNPANGAWTVDIIGVDTSTGVVTYADPTNPTHFDRFKDKNGENGRVILNGYGLPANVPFTTGTGTGTHIGTGTGSGLHTTGSPGENLVEYYREGNLFLLGIPTVL